MDGHPPLVFRLHEGAPKPVREVLLDRGWEEYDEQEQEAGDWNLYWRASAFRSSDYENLLPWQRLNHHPRTVDITRKDCLARDLRRMKGTYGSSLYNFSPPTFILPKDYTRFLSEYTKHRPAREGGTRGGRGRSSSYWICKPVDLSRGRGIFIFEDIKDLAYNSSVIVQRYISNPLLISGYKFDLRIYVGVKSFHPLTIYMYQEGLVRFATVKYNLSYLDDLYAHLTNTSINKLSPFYTTDKGKVGQGCMWTMSKFRYFLHSQGINELLLWQQINNIVTLTLLAIAPSVPSTPNCVELFGFDILIDSTFKPWLLEVNFSPALTLDCQVDVAVKKGLIGDLIDLMDYSWMDSLRERGYQRERYKRPCYLSSQTSQIPVPLPPNYSQLQPHKRRSSSQSSHSLPKTVCEQPRSHQRISNSQCPHTQSLPLPEAICLQHSHKRSHRRSNPHAPSTDHWRYLPPLDLNRIRSARGCIINANIMTATKAHANRGLNPILSPHSRTTTAALNRRTRPALASGPVENGAPNTAEVTERDDDEEAEMEASLDGDVSSMTSDSPPLGLGGLAVSAPVFAGACKLPDIHSARQRPRRLPRNASRAPGREKTPPLRVGDFVLTFPFNTATLRASQDKLDVKTALQEIHKLIGQLAAGCSQPEKKRRRAAEEAKEDGDGRRCEGKGEFESLFWGPRDPPLLSDATSPVK